MITHSHISLNLCDYPLHARFPRASAPPTKNQEPRVSSKTRRHCHTVSTYGWGRYDNFILDRQFDLVNVRQRVAETQVCSPLPHL